MKLGPVHRLAALFGYREWAEEDTNRVVLQQRHESAGPEKRDGSLDTVDIGIYHDSVGITGRSLVSYPSGIIRSERTAIYIPLEDKELLTAIRDLIQRALDGGEGN